MHASHEPAETRPGGASPHPGPSARVDPHAELVKRRARMLRWSLNILAGLVWFYVMFGDSGLFAQLDRHREKDQLAQELAAIEAQAQALRDEVQALAENDLAIESAIRSELDYQRPGEIVIVLDPVDPLEN